MGGPLGPGAKTRIMLGVLGTPGPGVAAWALPMGGPTRQIWQGCMAHGVALCMGGIAKLQVAIGMGLACKPPVAWANNHPAVPKTSAARVHQHPLALGGQAGAVGGKASYPPKVGVGLYMPGGTRVPTAPKMPPRIVALRGVLVALPTDTGH